MKIFMHYLRRASLDPIGLLIFILLPVALVFLNVEINVATSHEIRGQAVATNVVLMIMLMFQLMSGSYISEYICLDLKGATRWRLLAAPVSLNKYLFSAMFASLFFSLLTGAIVLTLGYFIYDVYMGNIVIIIAAMLLTALFGQFLGIILALLVDKSGTCTAVHLGISWGIFILSGFFGGITLPVVGDVFTTYGTPFSAAIRAVMHSGVGLAVFEGGEFVYASFDNADAILSLGVLAGFVAVTGVAAVIIGRRRPI
ncbi:MAG: ABC transporter permease [Defluviitaleaceae bacterium]|nr:ABC transporter permease [Defluviitaleaceae bacterium]